MNLSENRHLKQQLDNSIEMNMQADAAREAVWNNVKLTNSYRRLYAAAAIIIILLLFGTNIYQFDSNNNINNQFSQLKVTSKKEARKHNRIIDKLKSENMTLSSLNDQNTILSESPPETKVIYQTKTIYQTDTILITSQPEIVLQKYIDTVYIEKLIAETPVQNEDQSQSTIIVIDNQNQEVDSPKRKIKFSFGSFATDTKKTKRFISSNN